MLHRGWSPSLAIVALRPGRVRPRRRGRAWAQANPALDDFLARDALRATLPPASREAAVRRFRLGQWAGQAESWVDWSTWASAADARRVIPDGAPPSSAASTAAPAVTAPHSSPRRSRTPRTSSCSGCGRTLATRAGGFPARNAAVDAAFERYDVAELAADPWGWRSEIEAWERRHGDGRVNEWPTNVIGRMAPATDRAYQLLTTGRLTHDGDPRLASHVAHCVARSTPHGDVITKDRKHSTRKIAAVAAIVAVDRAAWHATEEPEEMGGWMIAL